MISDKVKQTLISSLVETGIDDTLTILSYQAGTVVKDNIPEKVTGVIRLLKKPEIKGMFKSNFTSTYLYRLLTSYTNRISMPKISALSKLKPNHSKICSTFINGMIHSFINSPLDVIINQILINSGTIIRNNYIKLANGKLSTNIKKIHSIKGFKGFFTGVKTGMLVDGFTNVVAMQSYDIVKKLFKINYKEVSLFNEFLIQNLSTIITYSIVYPLTFPKFYLICDYLVGNNEYKGELDCFIKTFKNNKLISLYSGIEYSIIKAVLISAFEFIYKYRMKKAIKQ